MRARTRHLAFFAFAIAAAAHAQQSRTAVSINGLDTNPCTIASPCRSISAAVAQTNPGGELIAVDSGGYGAFTVDRAITVQAAPGVYAGLTAASGNAVTVNAGSSSEVVLRNLAMNGMGTGAAGVSATGSALWVHVESCTIQNFASWGVVAFINTRVSDTTIRHCGSGIFVDNAGAPVAATVVNVLMKEIDGGTNVAGGSALYAFRNATVTAIRSTAIKATLTGFDAAGGGVLNLQGCTAIDNNTGILVETSPFTQTGGFVRISDSFVNGNVIGVRNSVGTIETWGDNKVAGNGLDVSGTLITVAQQ